jgi:tetratricopeptide (TPR) repeat protein
MVVAVAAIAVGAGAFAAVRALRRRPFDLGGVTAGVRAATARRPRARVRLQHASLDRLLEGATRAARTALAALAAAARSAVSLAAELTATVRRRAAAPKQVAQLHSDWRLRQALQLNRRGMAARRDGRPSEAVSAHRRALVIYRDAGDRRHEAFTLGKLALAEAPLDHEAAVGACEAALSILRELDDARAEGQVLANLGALHHRAGRDDAAYRCWGDALERLDPSSPEHARIAERLRLAG